MKTKLLAAIVGSTFWMSAGMIASADPDFVGTHARGVDPHVAASSGTTPIDPDDDIAFEFGSAVLLPAAYPQIERAGAWLAHHPGHRIVIEGHTDRVGTHEYNQDLATRRAEAVRHHLMKKGIPSDRMVLVIYGEATPDDRRAVIYASTRPVGEIVAASLDHGHAEVAVWTNKGTLLREARTPASERQVIATRK
jgi:hypothetical protein